MVFFLYQAGKELNAMKKLISCLFTLFIILSLCACGPAQESVPVTFTFPEGTAVLGADISGMTKEAGWAAMEAKASGYTATISVDGVEATATAQDLGLRCSKDIFMACANAMEQNVIPDFTGLIGFNEGMLRVFVSQHFNKAVTEAAIAFDESAGEYVLVTHADGQSSNPNAIVAAVKDAICQLQAPQPLTGLSTIIQPVRSADDPQLTQALALANKMLSTQLTYTFSPDGKDTNHTVTPADIRSFVAIGEDGITPVINDEALDAYIAQLEDTYSIAGTTGKFKTTGGSTLNMTVSYNGHWVDGDALKEDMVKAIGEGASGKRTAPYKASGDRDMAYGGTYVEIDLTEQHLWFYKNGKRLLSTSLVSGNVADDCCTPTGIFSIYAKSVDTYLVGEDYRTFVNYWMPFHYGYGLHDATWRGSFGGTIYKYGGSHGCVNLPLKAASTLYKNASVGTKVIIYGGATSIPNGFKGTTSYDVADDVGSFKLNIKPKYSGGAVTYSSSNSSIASVSSNGTVTVHKTGDVTITVKVAKHATREAASTKVKISIHSACSEGRHPWGDPVTVKAPSCVPGSEKVTCTKCGKTTERELAAVKDHSYSQWTTVTEATCGKDGSQERSCSGCGKKETQVIPATGNHSFGQWTLDKKPTCIDAGSEKRTCSGCGKTETRAVDPTGVHNYDTWVCEKEATCTQMGTDIKVCGVCGKASGESISTEAKGHDPVTQTEEATCTQDGIKRTVCKTCKETLSSETIPAKGHSFVWKTVKKATCTAAGLKQEICERCSKVNSEETIPATGHSFGSGATCNNCSEPNPNYTPSSETSAATE